MSIIKLDKLYSVVSITHRATGCYHLVVTSVPPEEYTHDHLVGYMNDYAKRNHKISNYAMREFAIALSPLSAEDFDRRVLHKNIHYSEAKAKALIETMQIGVDKLLTANLVKPVLWELNVLAKLRLQTGKPSPYVQVAEDTGPLTPQQNEELEKLLLRRHTYGVIGTQPKGRAYEQLQKLGRGHRNNINERTITMIDNTYKTRGSE